MPYLNKETPNPEPIDCKILTAGLDLFVEKGYHNVSIHEVRELADVSIGSIYRYFGGKEGIAQALYKHILNEVDELIDRVTQAIPTPVEQLEEIIRQLFEHTETHRNIIAFVFHSKHSDFLADQPLICDAAPFVKIRQITADAIKNNDLKDINTSVATSIIFGSAMRMIQLRLDGSIEEPLTNYFEMMMNSIWNGIKPGSTNQSLKDVNAQTKIAV
jgi:TetR/AcrR family transcriptional regulator, repressor of fatR-cypB operon